MGEGFAESRECPADEDASTVGAVDAFLHDLLRDAQPAGDLRLRETFEEEQLDGLALLVGERGLYCVTNLIIEASGASAVIVGQSFHGR